MRIVFGKQKGKFADMAEVDRVVGNAEKLSVATLVGQGDDKQLSMAPSVLQEFITNLRNGYERQAMMGESPILLRYVPSALKNSTPRFSSTISRSAGTLPK